MNSHLYKNWKIKTVLCFCVLRYNSIKLMNSLLSSYTSIKKFNFQSTILKWPKWPWISSGCHFVLQMTTGWHPHPVHILKKIYKPDGVSSGCHLQNKMTTRWYLIRFIFFLKCELDGCHLVHICKMTFSAFPSSPSFPTWK